MASTGCCITLPPPPLFNRFLPLWIMSFQAESLFILIHSSFLWRFSRAEACAGGSSSAPLFSLLGYVWEQLGQQIGFRYNVIIIDLPVAKEADRWASKINQSVHAGRGRGSRYAQDRKWCCLTSHRPIGGGGGWFQDVKSKLLIIFSSLSCVQTHIRCLFTKLLSCSQVFVSVSIYMLDRKI